VTSNRLKERLKLVAELRQFAAKDLALEVDGHYRKYADLHRPYVVWNVQAAPEFSMEPKSWWYPFLGRLEYRGYFSEKGATNYANWLRRRGYDVTVGGVSAYSTLGWFKDPLLNTFLFDPTADLAETIFHELSHQRVFAHGDTDFNEAFATTVGQEATRRWLQSQGKTEAFEAYMTQLERNNQFVHLVTETRRRLEHLYGDTRDKDGKVKRNKAGPTLPEQAARREKSRILDHFRQELAQLRSKWGETTFREAWVDGSINNAHLNAIANYYDLVPGFEELLALNGGDLTKFYEAAEGLASKSKRERHEWLNVLAQSGRERETNTPAGAVTNLVSRRHSPSSVSTDSGSNRGNSPQNQ
jgi:predicted aminopeptidase